MTLVCAALAGLCALVPTSSKRPTGSEGPAHRQPYTCFLQARSIPLYCYDSTVMLTEDHTPASCEQEAHHCTVMIALLCSWRSTHLLLASSRLSRPPVCAPVRPRASMAPLGPLHTKQGPQSQHDKPRKASVNLQQPLVNSETTPPLEPQCTPRQSPLKIPHERPSTRRASLVRDHS